MKYQAARQIFVRLALMPCSRCPSNQLENKNTKEQKQQQQTNKTAATNDNFAHFYLFLDAFPCGR